MALGARSTGGDSSALCDALSAGVAFLASSETAFAAVKTDGGLICWGEVGEVPEQPGGFLKGKDDVGWFHWFFGWGG